MRQATIADSAAILRIAKQFLGSVSSLKRALPSLISATQVFVHTEGTTIAGILLVEDVLAKDAPSLHILNYGVDSKLRGKGIGEKLLVYAELLAKQRGCERLTVDCHLDNKPAMALYRKHGMRIAKRWKEGSIIRITLSKNLLKDT